MKLVKEVKAQARHPVQIAVLMWWFIACLAQLTLGPPPSPIVIEPRTSFLLLSLLALSSFVCLVGSLIRDVILGFALEKFGWIGIVVLFIFYGEIIISLSTNLQTGMSAVLFPAFIIGGGMRIRQIHRAQKRLKLLARHEIEPEQ